jgi:phytanoyl-CoA dioxygenase PhyH
VAGQTELTSQQRRSLAGDGYLLVPSVLAAGAVEALAGRLDNLARATVAEWDAAPGEQPEEAGVVRLRLDPADPCFAPCVRHPLLFAAAGAVIGPGCRVSGLSLRAPLPGCGHQGLHPDFFPGHRTSGPWQVLAAMWCITEFTPDNGPLRVIPGSHRTNHDPVEDMEFPGMGPHPDEVKLIAPAGSLILFNSASLWHSGTLNYSPGLRLAATAYLSAPAKAQPGAASGDRECAAAVTGRATGPTSSPDDGGQSVVWTPSTAPRALRRVRRAAAYPS